jgi:DNA repair protein RecO (recombination protein O)
MESTPAILLRRTRLTETSLIVTWFTEKHGKLKTVAKGARRPRSPFAGKLDLFYEADIQFAWSTRSELHGLREVALKNPHEGLGKAYRRTLLASYFVELIELVTELEHPAPELFNLLRRAFGYLETNEPTRRALDHFEAESARLLGIHQQGQASIAIGRVYHRLPKGRAELLRQLS